MLATFLRLGKTLYDAFDFAIEIYEHVFRSGLASN